MHTIEQPLAFYLRRIRRLQQGRGMLQRDVAAIAGVPVQTIARYERARTLPRAVRTLLHLAHVYNLPVDALISGALHERVKAVVTHNAERATRRRCARS